MKRHLKNRPPRLPLALFRAFCLSEFLEDIEGDLQERFHYHLKTYGLQKAKWLFAKEVFLLFRPRIVRFLDPKRFINMKNSPWPSVILINLLVIVVILSPFLPGPPNQLVHGLSILGQSAGFFGLLLIPIGVIWLILENGMLKKTQDINVIVRTRYCIGLVSTIVMALICLILASLCAQNPVAGIAAVIPAGFIVYKSFTGLRKITSQSIPHFLSMPFYLLTIPVIAFITRIYLIEPVSRMSREYAMERSEILINSIEEYKNSEGRYPESLADLGGSDFDKATNPFVMGIQTFRYNHINNRYSLSFSQWLHLGSTEEIVLYDKDNLRSSLSGQYAMYDYKFDLCRIKGAYEKQELGVENWQSYLID